MAILGVRWEVPCYDQRSVLELSLVPRFHSPTFRSFSLIRYYYYKSSLKLDYRLFKYS